MTSFTFVIIMLALIVPVVLVIAGLILGLGYLFRLLIKIVPTGIVTALAIVSFLAGTVCMLYVVISGIAAIFLACVSMALVIWGVYTILNRS